MASQSRSTRLVVAVFAIAGCLIGAPANAQQGWTGLRSLTLGGTSGDQPRVAAGPNGDAIGVWTQYDASGTSVAALRYSAATGSWPILPQMLSVAGQVVMAARIGIDGGGNATAIWVRYDGALYYLQSVRYTAATQTWSAARDVATIGAGGMGPELVVTPGGDAIALWTRAVGLAAAVYAAHYSSATDQWGAALLLSRPADTAYMADIAVAPGGDALAVWTRYDGVDESIEAARYTVGGGWAAPRSVSGTAPVAEVAAVGVDARGNGVAIWRRNAGVEGARYDATGDTWGTAAPLSIGVAQGQPALAVAPGGDAVAVWRVSTGALETARLPAAGTSWQSGVLPGVTQGYDPAVAVDSVGNAVAIWRGVSAGLYRVQSARFVQATGVWSPARGVLPTAWATSYDLTADSVGNLIAVWAADTGADVAVQSMRWSAAPLPPTVTAITSSPSGVFVQLTPPVTSEAAFAPTAYEYSISTAAWVTVPAASPMSLPPLRTGVWYLMVRAVNAAGAGEASGRPFDVVPQAPPDLVAAAVVGNTVTLTWTPPADAGPDTRYLLEGGVVPGQVLASLPTGSATPTFTFAAPSGQFYLRIIATYFQLRSLPSPEIRIAVDVPVAPSPPDALLGLVQGTALSLSWTPTYGGGTPTALRLDVQGPVSGSIALPPGESFAYPAVPPGTYTMRLVAMNAAGASAPSNAVTLTFPGPCSGVPHAPTHFVASAGTGGIALSWSPPTAGTAVTGYTLLVSGSFVGALPLTTRTVAGPVPPGTYTVRVVATNACGASGPTPSATVVVP